MAAARFAVRNAIAADLIAVLVAVTSGDPRVLTIQDQCALPSGPSSSRIVAGRRGCALGSSGKPGYRSAMSRAALYIRRPGSRRRRTTCHLDQLSRPDPRAAGLGRTRGELRSWYSYFLGKTIRDGDPSMIEAPSFCRGLRAGLRAGRGWPETRKTARQSRGNYLWLRWPRLERGTLSFQRS